MQFAGPLVSHEVVLQTSLEVHFSVFPPCFLVSSIFVVVQLVVDFFSACRGSTTKKIIADKRIIRVHMVVRFQVRIIVCQPFHRREAGHFGDAAPARGARLRGRVFLGPVSTTAPPVRPGLATARAGFPDPGPETTVHFSPLDSVQSYWRPCASTLHLVKTVGTQVQVDPTGQFAEAVAEFVNEISATPVTNPATIRPDIRYMGSPQFSAAEKLTIVTDDCHSRPMSGLGRGCVKMLPRSNCLE